MSASSKDPSRALNKRTPSFPNPNLNRNRIPGEAELVRLQELADTNARIMRILDGEIEQLRNSYDTIHSRYIDLQMELEATQSVLHKTNDLLTTVQNQHLGLQIQQDDLRALMHPLRRCPDEILAKIFALTIPYAGGHGEKWRQSVCLSGVCQRWRNVALDTPRLWSEIDFRLSKPSESQRFLRVCILPRLKQAPANVTIGNISSDSLPALRECRLQDIPVIGTLTLIFSTPASLQHILGPSFHPPVGTLITLYLYSMAPPVRPETQRITPNFDILRAAARFPPFHKLITKGFLNLIFPVAATNPNITELDISDVGQVDILRLLQIFPRLQHMAMSNAVLVANDMHSTYHIPSIESICLFSTTGQAWMEHVFFPKLTRVVYAADTEGFCTFLSRHPSITELELIPKGDDIIGIATVGAQLEKLHITPPLGSFCRSLDLGSQIPFPSLKSLTITVYSSPDNLTLADFEAVVRTLCLPMRHPRSQATRRPSLVSTFAIGATTSAAASAHIGWHESDLYKESTKTVDVKDPAKVYLSWPEWE